MNGFPKYLNSREDVDNMKDLCPKETAAYLQTLLDGRFVWTVTGELTEGDDGLTDDTHKVVEEDRDGQVVRFQMARQEDPSAHLYRLGLTVEETEAIVAAAQDV